MDISSLLWRRVKGLAGQGAGDLADETHLVQRQLVLPRRALHDRREERLRVEEAGKPDRVWERELGNPPLELPYSQKEICVPGG